MPRSLVSNRFLSRNFPYSVSYNGSTQYAQNATANTVSGSGAFTIGGWIKITPTGAFQRILAIGSAAHFFTIQISDTNFFGVAVGGVKNTDSTFAPNANTWYFVAATYDGGANSACKLYVNNNLVLTDPQTNNLDDTIFIEAAIPGGSAYKAKCLIAQSFLYSRALSTTELTNAYYNGSFPSSGLLALYQHTDGSGTTITDSSGNGKNLTITGSAPWISTNVPMQSRVLATNRILATNRRPLAAPLDISGLVEWHRSDIGITLNGSTVSSWLDLSGSGNNLTQATAANQPTYLSSDVNNHPSLSFDGINDYLSTSYTLGRDHTVFAVLKMRSLGASGAHDGVFDGITGTAALLADNTPRSYMFAGAVVLNGTVGNGVYAYTTCVFHGSLSSFRNNGTQVDGNAGGGIPNGATLGSLAGGSRTSAVSFAEFIVYNTLVSASDITTIETYLKNRYGL